MLAALPQYRSRDPLVISYGQCTTQHVGVGGRPMATHNGHTKPQESDSHWQTWHRPGTQTPTWAGSTQDGGRAIQHAAHTWQCLYHTRASMQGAHPRHALVHSWLPLAFVPGRHATPGCMHHSKQKQGVCALISMQGQCQHSSCL